MNVGTIDCNTSGELCEDLGVDFGTYYYKANQLKAGKGVVSDYIFTLKSYVIISVSKNKR